MARSPIDLPRMQNQPRPRVPAGARVRSWCRWTAQAPPPKPRKPQLMRQYELIERVKQYNPKTNEELLNRAYVYAMRAHGEQKRASGDPYFSHPLEVAAILTDLKLDDATIAAALLHDTIEDTDATRAEIDRLFGHDIGLSGRGADQAEAARTRLQGGQAGRKPAQALARHRRRRAGAADQARRPPAQYAHARPSAARGAPAHRRGDARNLRAARRPHGHAGDARGARGPGVPRTQSGSLQGHHRAARSARRAIERLDRRDRAAAHQETRRPRHRRRGLRPAQARLFDLAQDGAQGGRLRAAVRYFRLPRRRRQRRRVLSGARHRAHHLAGRSGPLQGLHLHAEAERLPLDPHHRDRAGQAARRAANPHPRNAADRRIRHRRACALQGRAGLADRDAVARIERLCVAAPHHRAAGRRLQSGRISRAHQARTVPRPGVLLHARRAS